MERPENYAQPVGQLTASERDFDQIDPATNEPDWIGISRDAFTNSTLYFDANIRKQMERNLSMFAGRHPKGSKYYSDAYKNRSKIFRPKIRSTIRRNEAAAAIAFFATQDAVSATPEDAQSDGAVRGARYGKNWLDFRLEHSIPWFKTILGAYQDAMNQGIVISRQEWLFEEEETKVKMPKIDPTNGLVDVDERGQIIEEEHSVFETIVDKPNITLVPVENFRFSTAADWRDPVGTSPFLIEMMPMYVGDVKERMEVEDNKTLEPKWNKLEDGQIKSANKTGEYDSIRLTREENRQDSTEEDYVLQQFDVVWVHRNIIRHNGTDWLYYTLGTEFLLSDPVPVSEVYLQGRPYTIGSAIIETHKAYPSGLPELTQDLTTLGNEIANQRIDNVKLVMNKRYFARKGANVDWRSLVNSVPGSITLMSDVNTDVKEQEFHDVTGSSYQEQDRVNTDFDDLVGNFSQSSVPGRRNVNDTVGGMAMQLDDSNIMVEYQLRCFTESWVEDTLRQLITMGQKYETDPKVLSIIGEGADPDEVASLMDTAYNVKVAMGFGATSPHKRIEKLSIGLKTLAEIMPGEMQNLNADEIKREIFGAMGWRNGDRFFNPKEEGANPEVDQLKQQVQQLTQLVETKKLDTDAKIQIAQIKAEMDVRREQMKLEFAQKELELTTRIDYIGKQVDAEKNDIARGELILQQEALEFKKREREIELLTEENDRMSSVLMNDKYGDVPAAEG